MKLLSMLFFLLSLNGLANTECKKAFEKQNCEDDLNCIITSYKKLGKDCKDFIERHQQDKLSENECVKFMSASEEKLTEPKIKSAPKKCQQMLTNIMLSEQRYEKSNCDLEEVTKKCMKDVDINNLDPKKIHSCMKKNKSMLSKKCQKLLKI